MRSPLAQQIRNARRAAGLTQLQLGSRLGLKGRAVYRWERDESSPTKRHRRALVLAIQAVNPAAASALAAIMVNAGSAHAGSAHAGSAHAGSAHAGSAPPPNAILPAVPPAARPAVDPSASLERAVYQIADELDVPARRVRVALVRLFARLREANFTLEIASQQLEAQTAEVSSTP